MDFISYVLKGLGTTHEVAFMVCFWLNGYTVGAMYQRYIYKTRGE